MPSFLVDVFNENKIILSDEESRHCLKVLRKKCGDLVDLTDGSGMHAIARVTNIDKRHCQLEIIEKHLVKPDPYHVHIAIAPVKSHDRLEWLVEKTTEIGIHEISFIASEFAERKVINLTRLNKKAKAALKQSGGYYLPVIHEIVPFKIWIGKARADEMFVAHPKSAGDSLLSRTASPGKGYILLIGPEGGFSEIELEQMQKECFHFVSLGKHILRAETAGIVGCQMLCEINF